MTSSLCSIDKSVDHEKKMILFNSGFTETGGTQTMKTKHLAEMKQ